jgi:two-component system, NtrC family, response regulator AtoC
MGTGARVLVVDDEPGVQRYVKTLLELDSHLVETVSTAEAAISRIRQAPTPDLVLLDLMMPGTDGLQALEQLRKLRPGLKVVVLSCSREIENVVRAMQLGAHSYLTKPFEKHSLDAILEDASRNQLADPPQLEELGDGLFFLASSPAMKEIHEQIKTIASLDVPVLMLGESGTGKEILSRLIHKYSKRAQRDFLKVNCAALPSDLLESELFGYDAGAFTGAVRSKPGKFELGNKGTILLDEIGEMPASLQAKLLHVLQDQQFCRLGGRSSIQVDVRILAATNIDVKRAIANKTFREDLYYRINAFTIMIPPLRERREEIPLLLNHGMARFAASFGRAPLAFSAAMVAACLRYPWPGNLRELSNFIKRYLILGDESLAIRELQPADKLDSPVELRPDHGNPASRGLKSMMRDLRGEAEAVAIAKALEQTGWNRKEAAKLLNISYKAILYKIKQYNLSQAGPDPGSTKRQASTLPIAEWAGQNRNKLCS